MNIKYKYYFLTLYAYFVSSLIFFIDFLVLMWMYTHSVPSMQTYLVVAVVYCLWLLGGYCCSLRFVVVFFDFTFSTVLVLSGIDYCRLLL